MKHVFILILFIIFFFLFFHAYYEDKIDLLNHTIYHLKEDNFTLKNELKYYKKKYLSNKRKGR